MTKPVPAAAVWALGMTQIVGYGSLYYSFSVLAPAIAGSFGWSTEWIFGSLTLALLVGGLAAPFTGRMLDRFGAARSMSAGSVLVSLFLVLMAIAPDGPFFVVALMGMEVASTLVLYAAAFAVLVQLGGRQAQASITHLTLIAGFASTLFWPATAFLDGQIGWRASYVVFATINIVVCLPLHLWLSRISDPARLAPPEAFAIDLPAESPVTGGPPRLLFSLVLIGFALQGLVLAAVTLQMVPLLQALDLGTQVLLISSIFGPAQVLARLINMVFGGKLAPTTLAVIAAASLPLALLLLTVSAPAMGGAVAFALIFGLGSGLTSIVSGSLPLHLFGRHNYGARQGQISAARQMAAAIAPFTMALAIGHAGVAATLWSWTALALLPVACFGLIIPMRQRAAVSGNRTRAAPAE
ncbi:arsenite efflux MFS transporter ArsK [uncultured Devosia sp.]|uniref:arsenite efflux MFS transporter ArsK n=1 Tax=uncultured Devosia sp. TaxID=211434 RepID=UPI002631D264|nr:arsenite efflux MFS transporter ArsK [uncultured Devosia sp.]